MLCVHSILAQGIIRLTGPLGVYHIATDYAYSDSSATDSILMEYEFRFGDLAISNSRVDDGDFTFINEADSAISWHANRAFGIINPPSEHGVDNQPADTALYLPSHTGAGMIQGGMRFSRLSQLYSGFSGVALDDWDGDTLTTHGVYDAVHGKYVDAYGNVCSQCPATTPYNRLYCVLYGTGAIPSVMPYMDGLYFSYINAQNCCYANLDSDINTLMANFPQKEIMIAIFLQNTHIGWADPDGVHYMLAHALDRYDDGDINEVSFFAGDYLVKKGITLNQWDSFALPHWLDSLYFPYLGQGQGHVYDCASGSALPGAAVHVFCQGRLSGYTLPRSMQIADAEGAYQCGLWAGNRATDSTCYWLVAEKAGYIPDTARFWIRRGDTAAIPDVSLCPAPYRPDAQYMTVYPNPTGGTAAIELSEAVDGTLDIYDMLGKNVSSTTQSGAWSLADLSSQPDGVYLAVVRSGGQVVSRSRIVVRH
jgi:hypothetical protein